MPQRKNPFDLKQANFMKYIILAFVVFLIFTLLTSTTFITIPAGSKGVQFKRFSGGIQKEKVYDQGFHIVMPWNDMIIYDVRYQEGEESMDVLSKNGLSIQVDLSYRFSPIGDRIGHLHDEVGIEYRRRIIQPEIRSATREVIGKYLPEELYSTKREAIQTEIFEQTKKSIEAKNIALDAVLVKSVQLPVTLRDAIEQKLEEEQLSFQFDFKLDRERKEAERKIIEAQAKADANKILNASLTDKILKDKGIEATLELAQSPNSKVVIVGGGEGGGLPLILGNQ